MIVLNVGESDDQEELEDADEMMELLRLGGEAG